MTGVQFSTTVSKALFLARHPSMLLSIRRGDALAKWLAISTDEMIGEGRKVWEARDLLTADYERLLVTLKRIGREDLRRVDYKLDWVYYVSMYLLVRWLKPSVVVETGVGYGLSSKVLLTSMRDNGTGELYSIDLPNAKFLDEGGNETQDFIKEGDTGSVVAKELREAWHLFQGDSKIFLNDVLSRLKTIDVFVHDSAHTSQHMLFEYNTALPYIRSGGLLISDDADYTPAFARFSRESNLQGCEIEKNKDHHTFGIIRKP